MPFVCKFCHQKFCAEHRLPENHACAGLTEYRARARAEGRLMAPEPAAGEGVRPTVARGAAWGASFGRLFARLDGRVAWVFLGLMVAVWVFQFVLVMSGAVALHSRLFVMDRGFLVKPWVLVTSIFAHDPRTFTHILFNGITLAFAGPIVESLLGSRRFSLLFLGAGALGGVGQVFLGLAIGLPATGVLGASGAIFGLLGTLVVLAPRMTVAIMGIIPAPLWVLIAFYALFDFMGAFARDGVAHLAHLSGLGVGMAYGKSLRDRGLRAYARPAMPRPGRRG